MISKFITHIPKDVLNYLDKQDFQSWELEKKNDKLYSTIIVIPALDEFTSLKDLLNSLEQNDPNYLNMSLIIVVINNLKSHSDQIKRNNQETIDYLRAKYISDSKSLLNLGIVDASSFGKELPEKNGGVGFARKLGMDFALMNFDYQNNNKNIIICLDADCLVKSNYLEEISKKTNAGNSNCGFINFEHKANSQSEEAAIINYEIFLRYYVLGLKYANSPFAFHSIGSTMYCDVNSYIKVDGMNKRKAGEDFYFMQKLAIISQIDEIKCTKVYPSARPSWRVPFGTGQRVNRFLSQVQNEYLLYSPQSFEILKNWLSIFGDDKNHSSNILIDKAKEIHKDLYDFLFLNHFPNAWNKILQNSNSEKQLNLQKKLWMNGFRTMKLIHYLKDNSFPQINMFFALNDILHKMNYQHNFSLNEKIPPIDIQIKYIELLRKLA